MSANWGSQNPANYLSYAAGSFVGSGAYTMVLLVDPAGPDMRFSDWFVSATEKGQFLNDFNGGGLYGKSDFSSGVQAGLTTSSPWALVAITKTSGSVTYRMHYWTYDSSGAGTMTHAVATGAGNHANETGTATTCRVGFAAGSSMNGSIAVAAFFDRALTDLELELLKTSRLSEWASLVPQLGVHFASWNGTAGTDVVWAGSSGTCTEVGTVGNSTDPSSFDFTVPTPTVTIRNGITGGTNSTANTTAYTTSTISSGGLAVGDLFVVYVASTGCTDAAPTLTASDNGTTFTLVDKAVKNSSGDTLYCYIADQLLPASPLGTSFTFTCTGATGVVISVAIATGMTRSGTQAVKQSAKVDNVASGTAPTTTFSGSALSTNPTLIGVLASAGSTIQPAGWVERVDATYGSPTTCGGYASRDSGFIGTAITYQSTANGLCCALALELDSTLPPSGFDGWGVSL